MNSFREFFLAFSLMVPLWSSAELPPTSLEMAKSQVLQQEQKQRRLLGALYEINVGIHSAVQEKSKLNKQKMSLEAQVESLNKSIEALNVTTQLLQSHLGERLRLIQHWGGASVLQILFASQSASVVDRNLKIMGMVAQKERDAVKEYMRAREELRTKKNKLDFKMSQLHKVEAGLVSKEAQLFKEQNLKNKILEGVKKRKTFAETQWRKLQKDLRPNSDDDGLLDTLYAPSFADHKGRLLSPLKGRVVRGFGVQKGLQHPWVMNHKGLRLSTHENQSIKSVFAGTVSWVGQIQAWGSTVIVDHGDHYYTVYSGLENVLVESGHALKEGQPLAQIQQASAQHPSEIYFEIRHFSEPDDPQQWLKGTTL